MKYHDSPCPQCGRPVPDQAQEGLCPRCALAAVASPTEPAPDPAGLRPPPSPEKLAAALPQFEIVRLIGQGGMASVFQARQPQLNRFVALKILQLGDEPDPVFAERFAREAQALAALSHPNIVTIHDFGQAKGFYYLVMEYVDGVSLRALLREGRLEPETALGIVPKICEALEFAHERGVVHRDIKPENILLDKSGRVKIADFGIAKMMGESFVASSGEAGRGETSPLAVPPESLRLTEGQVLGTPSYMAPEQVTQPQQTDHRADIYSLGVVFYEMLTGELPVGQFPPPSVKVQLDVRLDQVVLRALEKTPQRRYQHVSEVRSEVETITGAGGAPIAGPPGPRFPLWFESEGRRRLHWPGVMALVSQVGLTVIAVVSLLAFVLWLFGAPARITFTRGEILLLAPLAVLCIIMYWAARAAPRVMPREDRTGTAPARKTRLATALLALLTALVVAIVVTPATVTFLTITALRWFQQQRPSPAAVPDAGSSESSAGTPALSRPVSADPTPSPIEFTVAPDGAGAYESIQRALDAAPEGATVRIVAGRYDESLQITKSVALVGAGWQRTVIGPIKPEPPPNAETLRELERRVRSAPTDAERERLREEARAQFTPPVMRIEAAADARFEGLQFHQPGTPPEGKLVDSAAIEVLAGSAHFDACAMVGSPGNGLLVQDGAEVTVSNSLIAAAWNAGLRVARGQNARVRVVDSDIRNCHYAGIVIGHGQSQAIVERCRISGSAWHGVRYDHASPTLASNLIFGNARCGIYASGRTAARVVGNVLWRNEMNGMACWFENRDHIVRNTFAANHREGLSVLGASGPLIEHNVFWNHTQAVYQGNISDPAPNAQASEILRLHENLFWHNPIPVASSLATDPEPSPQPVPIPLASFPGNLDVDPGFRDPDNGDFTLLEEGAAMKSGAGAPAPLPQASSWPLQPQEAAIIPAGDTRDYRLWKRPEPS